MLQKLDLKFTHESAESAWDELLPLIKSHFNEISYHQDIGISPDKSMYIAACNGGFYKLFTVRDGKNLIGYAGYFLQRHPHVNAIQANSDLIYIRPDYRGHGAGKNLIQFADTFLKTCGVSIVYLSISEKMDFSKMIEPMGYLPVDRSYARRL